MAILGRLLQAGEVAGRPVAGVDDGRLDVVLVDRNHLAWLAGTSIVPLLYVFVCSGALPPRYAWAAAMASAASVRVSLRTVIDCLPSMMYWMEAFSAS